VLQLERLRFDFGGFRPPELFQDLAPPSPNMNIKPFYAEGFLNARGTVGPASSKWFEYWCADE